jgi:hypothetical protein
LILPEWEDIMDLCKARIVFVSQMVVWLFSLCAAIFRSIWIIAV